AETYLKPDGHYPTKDHELAASHGPPLAAAREVEPVGEPIPAFVASPGGDGKPWGAVAEFANPRELLAAAHHARRAGYTHLDAWTPYPVHGMISAIGRGRSRLPLFTLA